MWNRFIAIATFRACKILARLFPPQPRPLPRQARLILVFSTTGLGDGLFDSAAIRSLKLGHPTAKLIVCAHRTRQSVALHNPCVDEVVPFGKSPFRQVRLLWRFRRHRPDLVVVLHVNEEVYPLAYWINRDAVVTLANLYKRYAFLSAHPVNVQGTQHAVVLPLKVAQYAGGSAIAPRMIYEVRVDELAAIRARFTDWIDHPYVVFQTGGGKTLFWRDWPVEHYVTLIRWFSDRFAHKVILTGGLENLERANAMERACPEVINLPVKPRSLKPLRYFVSRNCYSLRTQESCISASPSIVLLFVCSTICARRRITAHWMNRRATSRCNSSVRTRNSHRAHATWGASRVTKLKGQ